MACSHSYERSLRSENGVGREPSPFRSTRRNLRGGEVARSSSVRLFLTLTARRPRHRPDRTVVHPLQLRDGDPRASRRARGRPQPHRLIRAARRQRPPVRLPRDAPHPIGVALKRRLVHYLDRSAVAGEELLCGSVGGGGGGHESAGDGCASSIVSTRTAASTTKDREHVFVSVDGTVSS